MPKAIEGVAMLGAAVADGVAMFAMASTGVGVGALPFMAHLMAALVTGGIAMEAGALGDMLLASKGMTVTTRQAAGYRQIIIGEYRVAATMIYESTTGSEHDQYNMVLVWSGHECDSIVNVYLDGRKIYWQGSGVGWVVRNGIGSGGIADGNDHVGPDGQTYNFGGTGHSGIYVESRFGDQSDGDVIGGLTANDPHWAATLAGSPWVGGCCYSYLKVEYNQSLFPQFPQPKATIRGLNRIYDPRTGTYGWSNNWALIINFFLTDQEFGLGDVGAVNEDQLIAAANVCDETVNLAAGGTEARYTCNWRTDTSMSPGDILQTLMSCAAGRLSRIGGEWFIWPGYYQGPSFTFDESVLTAPVQWNPYKSFKDLWNRVAGTYIAPNFPYNSQTYPSDLYDTNGWYDGSISDTWPFAWQPDSYPQYAQDPAHGYPTDALLDTDSGVEEVWNAGHTYNAGDVVGFIVTVNGIPFETVWESLIDSNTGNTPNTSPDFWQNAAILLPKEINQAACISIAQAQRVAKIMLLRNRQQGSGTLEMNLIGFQLQPVTTFEMNFAALGWTNKLLEVTQFRTSIDRDSQQDSNGKPIPVLRVQLDVQETDPSVYEWDPATEELSVYEVPNSPTQTPSTIAPPTSLAVSGNAPLIGADGIVTPRLSLTWNDPASVVVTLILVQFRLHGATDWTNATSVSVGLEADYLSGVIAGQSYDVRIAGLAQTGAQSAWDEVDNVAVVAPNSLQSSYQIDPQFVLTQPTATSIALAACTCSFGGAAAVNYAARTFTIPTPSVPTWYYVTIADATQQGESGATLTATCQTSNALVGVQGNTYLGAIEVTPSGAGAISLAGGWPSPASYTNVP